jgi:hypothetical protein
MALIPGYGGTVSLSIDGGGSVAFPVKNISITIERTSIDVTQLSDFREKRAPGRYRRTASFDMMAQDQQSDDGLRGHVVPANLANAINRTLTLTWANSSITYTLTGHTTSASRSEDGTGVAMWSITVEEA